MNSRESIIQEEDEIGTIIVIGIKVNPPAERECLAPFPKYYNDCNLNVSNAFIVNLNGDSRVESEVVRPEWVYQTGVGLSDFCSPDNSLLCRLFDD